MHHRRQTSNSNEYNRQQRVVARIIPLKRNKKKNERKMEMNERSNQARVRTMAVTVKFKSAEIYNGRCVAGRAL